MKALKKIYVALAFIFLYAPIVVLMVYSFNSSKSRGQFTGFSLKWYAELFSDRAIMQALWNTVSIALLAAVIATIFGTISAIGINSMEGSLRSAVMNLTYIPILNPDIVTGISLMILFVFMRVPLGYITMLLAHIAFNVPFVIISVLPKLAQLDKNLYEAALDLGASPWYAYRKVILPEILPGVVTGFLLAFTLSIDDFVISFFTTGAGVNNLSIYIYSIAKKGVSPSVNALSAIMFAVILALLLTVNKRTGQKNKGEV